MALYSSGTSAVTGGRLQAAAALSGSLIKAYQATNSSIYTISGATQFTGLSITLTPTSSSSKFLLIANIGHLGHSGGGATAVVYFTRSGTNLTLVSGASYNGFAGGIDNNTNLSYLGDVNAMYIDSPGTTSSITYAVMFNGDGTKWVGRRGNDSFLYASQHFQILEIA